MRSTRLLTASLRKLSTVESQVAVFDRALKSRQRNWSFKLPESEYYDYLRKEAADRIVDRFSQIINSINCTNTSLFLD
jgi:hypothetical protein